MFSISHLMRIKKADRVISALSPETYLALMSELENRAGNNSCWTISAIESAMLSFNHPLHREPKHRCPVKEIEAVMPEICRIPKRNWECVTDEILERVAQECKIDDNTDTAIANIQARIETCLRSMHHKDTKRRPLLNPPSAP
jgi:hypothetical protein